MAAAPLSRRRRVALAATRTAFSLEPGADDYELRSTPQHPAIDRWQPPLHFGRLRPALVLMAGESLAPPALNVRSDTRLRLQLAAGLPEISTDGFEVVVRFAAGDGATVTLMHTQISAPQARELLLPLPASGTALGTLSIDCLPGPDHDPQAD